MLSNRWPLQSLHYSAIRSSQLSRLTAGESGCIINWPVCKLPSDFGKVTLVALHNATRSTRFSGVKYVVNFKFYKLPQQIDCQIARQLYTPQSEPGPLALLSTG